MWTSVLKLLAAIPSLFKGLGKLLMLWRWKKHRDTKQELDAVKDKARIEDAIEETLDAIEKEYKDKPDIPVGGDITGGDF